MQAVLELYANDLSPFAQRIELQLEMKQLTFTRTVPQREYVKQGEFGMINPMRKIPVLVVNAVPIPETQVICELIEDISPELPLLPGDPLERARVRLLSRIVDIYVTAPLVQRLNNHWEKRSEDIAQLAINTASQGLMALEHWIGSGPYAVAEERTIADCAIPPALFFMKTVLPGFGIDKLPDVGPKTDRYMDTVKNDPDVSRCFVRMEKALQERLSRARV